MAERGCLVSRGSSAAVSRMGPSRLVATMASASARSAGWASSFSGRMMPASSEGIRFEGENRQQVYRWIEQVLRQQQYQKQGRRTRGLLRRYLGKMTGRSRAQVTRLIARYRDNGELQPVRYRRHRFPQRYTRADVELLATVDEAHETLSGPATRHILQRAYQQYGQPEYQRLASISVAHLYNLRQQPRYRQ